MKRLLNAGLILVALAAAAPANALTDRFNDSYRGNLDKGLSAEVNLSDRQQAERLDGLYRLTDRFDESHRDNLNKGLSTDANLSDRQQAERLDGLYRLTDRQRDEHFSGLNRLTERFNGERDTTLNR